MTKCPNCDGSGLAGAGEKPWLHVGAVGTCKVCSGTGKVEEAPSTPAEVTPEAVAEQQAHDEATGNVPKAEGADTVEGSQTPSVDAPKE